MFSKENDFVGINIKLGSAFNALPSAKIAFHSNDHGLVAIDNQDISLVAGNTYRYKIEILRVFKLHILMLNIHLKKLFHMFMMIEVE